MSNIAIGDTVRIISVFAALTIGITLLPAHNAAAVEIKVWSVVPLKASLDELGPQFERATGHKLMITYAGSSTLIKQFEAGEMFDVALIWPAMIDRLLNEGKVDAATRTDLARVAIGVAVKKGAPKPDIGTAEAFKRLLLDAKSISLSAEGASGTYMAALVQRLGIAAEVTPKLRPVPGGPLVVGPVAKGEVEIAVISIPYIVDEPGADLVGPVPAELQQYVVYTGVVGTAAMQPDASKAFIGYLTTLAAASVIKSKGLDPTAP